MSATEIMLAVMIAQLGGLQVTLTRLVPILRQLVVDVNEGAAFSQRLAEHFGLVPPELVAMKSRAKAR